MNYNATETFRQNRSYIEPRHTLSTNMIANLIPIMKIGNFFTLLLIKF